MSGSNRSVGVSIGATLGDQFVDEVGTTTEQAVEFVEEVTAVDQPHSVWLGNHDQFITLGESVPLADRCRDHDPTLRAHLDHNGVTHGAQRTTTPSRVSLLGCAVLDDQA